MRAAVVSIPTTAAAMPMRRFGFRPIAWTRCAPSSPRPTSDGMPPTLADVRARLAAASERPRGFGVDQVLVFGSVAAGTVSPASGVDLVHYARERLDFAR